MSTTNIDRVTTIQRVANRTDKTVIHDILLSNVLQLVTQKIPNALNSKKVQVFLPSFIYLLKDKPEYKPYIEPYQEKMKYTGRALHRQVHNEHKGIYVKRYNQAKGEKQSIR